MTTLIGNFKAGFNKAESIAWKNWEKREGKYLILALFGPQKYPNYTLSFLDEEKNLRVRKSLNEEQAKEVGKLLKTAKGKAYLILIRKSENEFEAYVEIEQNDQYHYNLEGKSFILRQIKEDLPF